MGRKKWTAKEILTDSELRDREKRKWQIALRRYVLERNPASFYAPFFGLDIDKFRNWIEIQFSEGMDWQNFGKGWQFGFIMPIGYFDLLNEDDLRLCWNFININVQRLDDSAVAPSRADVIAAKSYFSRLSNETGYPVAALLVKKIEKLESELVPDTANVEGFLNVNKIYLEVTKDFTSYEFDKLNSGIELKEIMKERAFLNKFR